MNKRDDRREGNRHCKERSSKDKVLTACFITIHSLNVKVVPVKVAP